MTSKRFGGDSTRWFESFPDVGVVGWAYPEGAQPGERMYAGRTYVQVGGDGEPQVRSTTILFDDEPSAIAAYQAIIVEDDPDGAFAVPGPDVGDAALYFDSIDGDDHETRLRFRIGPVIGRLSVISTLASFEEPTTVAQYAGPMIDRIENLLLGTLGSTVTPSPLATLMPPAAAAATVGPRLVDAVVPVDAWALVDSENNPTSTASDSSATAPAGSGTSNTRSMVRPARIWKSSFSRSPARTPPPLGRRGDGRARSRPDWSDQCVFGLRRRQRNRDQLWVAVRERSKLRLGRLLLAVWRDYRRL